MSEESLQKSAHKMTTQLAIITAKNTDLEKMKQALDLNKGGWGYILEDRNRSSGISATVFEKIKKNQKKTSVLGTNICLSKAYQKLDGLGFPVDI